MASAPDVNIGISDQEIVDSWQYMLSRWLVLRQESRDLKEGFQWNEIIHRAPGGVAWANPNLDVAYSEAWIAVDEGSATILTLPAIEGRYYTFQLLNGWGEVTLNINERTFPDHPSGLFALCLKGSKPEIPPEAFRIDLPNRKSRLLMRIELGADPDEAIRLQHATTLHATDKLDVPDPVAIDFDRFPGVDAFNQTEAILASEPDINPDMDHLQSQAGLIATAAKDPQARAHISDVIGNTAVADFVKAITRMGQEGHGWLRPRIVGNYGADWQMRSIANFTGIWANNAHEVIYFGGRDFDGSKTFSLTFPPDALPDQQVHYFWSVIAVDAEAYKTIPNALDRFLLNKQSALLSDANGSLTLWFAPERPAGSFEPNWLPTSPAGKYNLTFRFYGPSEDVVAGRYFPPPLIEH